MREVSVGPAPTDEEKRVFTPCIIDMTAAEAEEIDDHLRSYPVTPKPETEYYVTCTAPTAGIASGSTSITLENVPTGTEVEEYDEVYIPEGGGGDGKPYLITEAASESGGSITLTLHTGLTEEIPAEDPGMTCVIYQAAEHRSEMETWQKADYDWVQYEFLIPLTQATGFDDATQKNIRNLRVLVEPVTIGYNKVSSWKP
jgi:hypothetical protein